MPICPKCETEYRDGFDMCFDCSVELVDTISRPESLDTVEEDFAAEMFASPEEPVRICLNCLVEFAPEARICPPCGDRPLETTTRDAYEGILKRSPLKPYQEIEKSEAPGDVTCVFVAHNPADAGFAMASLEGMGVEAILGEDSFDEVEDPSHVGVWVKNEDVEACSMILPEDPNDWRDDEGITSEDPYAALVHSANTYAEIGKRNHAIALCSQAMEMNNDRPEAFFSLGRIVGAQGLVAQAHESFRAAVERSDQGAFGTAAWLLVVYGFLTEDREISFTGPKADEALALLKAHSEGNPRSMEAMRLLLEACYVRGEKANVAAVRERIQKVNRWVLEADGPHQSMGF